MPIHAGGDMDEVLIRRLTPDDSVDQVTALLHSVFALGPNQPYPYPAARQTPEATLKQIQYGNCWLAWTGDRLAGIAMLYRPEPHLNLESGAYLAHLAVHPDFQRRGIGYRLLETCEQDALSMGACGVWASSPVNSRQAFWYLRHGYRLLEYKAWPDSSYDSILVNKRLHGEESLISRVKTRVRYFRSLLLHKFGILNYYGEGHPLPKRLIAFGLWWVNKLRLSLRIPKRKDILLCCDEPYMADYLAPFWELFRHDPRLGCRLVLLFPSKEEDDGNRSVAGKLPIRQVSQRGMRLRPWDLVVCANHCLPKFVPSSPSVYIGHGPKCKARDGTELAYSDASFDRSGHPLYSLMFAETETEKSKEVTERPGLSDIIAVVGNLESDAVLAHLPRRDEYRKQFGFQAGETVVFVLSTWGEHCLWHTMGDTLLEEMRKLTSEFRFVLSAHPLEYHKPATVINAVRDEIREWKRESRFVLREHPVEARKQPEGGRIWGEYLRTQRQHGLTVREPSESWIPYMVACDIVVSDFTGLIEYAVLLQRRIVLTPVPNTQIWQESAVAEVRKFALILDDARFLRDRLTEAQANYPMEQLGQLARLVHPYPGEAAGRIRKPIYKVLGLAPLEAGRGPDSEVALAPTISPS
jgi:GNAT superfamily N-acetyltransferase